MSTIENEITTTEKSNINLSDKTGNDDGNAGIEERYNKVSYYMIR